MRPDAAPLNRGRIFVLALMALFTAGAAVSLRAATAVHMRAEYLDALDKARAGEMIGTVLGAAFAGFAITLFLVSAVLARDRFRPRAGRPPPCCCSGLCHRRRCRLAGRFALYTAS